MITTHDMKKITNELCEAVSMAVIYYIVMYMFATLIVSILYFESDLSFAVEIPRIMTTFSLGNLATFVIGLFHSLWVTINMNLRKDRR